MRTGTRHATNAFLAVLLLALTTAGGLFLDAGDDFGKLAPARRELAVSDGRFEAWSLQLAPVEADAPPPTPAPPTPRAPKRHARRPRLARLPPLPPLPPVGRVESDGPKVPSINPGVTAAVGSPGVTARP